MPSQREIRRRIGSVGNIKQITRAMQFVAASKLRRAQEATLASRPYSDKLDEVLADVAAVVDAEEHPLLAEERDGPRLIVLFTSDRGMAGSLNTNTIRFAAQEIAKSTGELTVVTVGRKGTAAMRRATRAPRRLLRWLRRQADLQRHPAPGSPHQRRLPRRYLRQGAPALPGLRLHARAAARDEAAAAGQAQSRSRRPPSPATSSSSSPSPAHVLDQLVPRYVATRLFQAVLELTASEHSSRMVAMRNATDNAQELIDDLTLTYNKVRQSNITREMIEIATGASST